MTREVEVSIARLPATGRELFGREAELAWLNACWDEGVHVASVVAWGGVGKTALVNRWLAGKRDKGWDGAQRVYGWSFYSQGTDRLGSSDEFVDAALRWFGDLEPTVGSPWDKGERLARLVRKARTLLVLDGAEPLQWGPGVQQGRIKDPALEALVKELGAQNKGLCLITSRIALADLDGLGGDKVLAKDLGSLSPEAGADLLKARGAKGTDEELREASTEYKGHGLALTLLGGYIRKRYKGDIRQRAYIPLLEAGPAQRMMGIYERWFAGKPEIAVLRLLGLFDRPATEDEIAALRAMPYVAGLTTFLKGLKAGAWNEAVTTLEDVGLLALASDHDDRLDAHPLVREHFGQQLRQKQPVAWREGHRRLYMYLKEKAEPLPETIEDMAPLYAAVVHGCLAGKNQEALENVYWTRIKRREEHFNTRKLGAFGGEVALLSAFFAPPWEKVALGLSEHDHAFVLNEAGFALRALGRLPDAAGLMRLSLRRSFAQQNWGAAASCASNLSELLQALGELNEALAQARTSVVLAERSGDAFLRMGVRTTLAAVLHAMRLMEEASAQFEEAERIQKEREPTYPLLYALQGFRCHDLLLDQGRDVEVRERATQTLQWTEAPHWLLGIALDHLALGRAHLLAAQRGAIGDLAQTASHLQQAVDGLRRAGEQDYLPRGLLARAALHTHTRDFPAARHDIDETLTLATRCGFRLHEADAYLGHARLALAEGHPAPAREHLAKARRIVDNTGYHRRDAELTTLEAEASEMARTAPHESTLPTSFSPPLPPLIPSTAHETVKTMLLLDATAIHELHTAALSAGLIGSREALMGGIDVGLVAGLHVAPSPAAQLMVDLNALNTTGALLDGTVPLQIWLANAAHLAGIRREAAVFARLRDRLSPTSPAHQGPGSMEPRPETMTPDRLLDRLGSLLPAQLETLIFRLGVPIAYLSGSSAPAATRSIEVLRWAEQVNRLDDVRRLLADVTDAGKEGAVTRDEILDALTAMVPGQLDLVVAKLAVPQGILPGAAAPQATRAVDVVRYVEAEGRLGELEAMLQSSRALVPAAPQVSIARLPATGKDLFGREAELAWLDACWEEGVRVASVVAFGGVGKSALVNAWLARMDSDGWRGAQRVYGWSFYSQGTGRLSSSDEFIAATLRWFGDPEPTQGSPWDKGERLAALVKKERTLLILDGVEPLQWGPGVQEGELKDPALKALVKELGAQNKGLCLITSRIKLADLDGLGGDKVHAKDLGSLSPEAGAQLLEARGAKGTDEELREASIEYKGHGLALTLLGGYIRKRYKGDIRQRAHIPLLEGKPAQRMMGIYERWFAGKPEIAVLRLLGLFDRPAQEDEIAALRARPYIAGLTMFLKGLNAGAWNEAVTTLQDVGLLAPALDEDDGLDAHPLVREHFGQQLRQKQPNAWREGHRRLYVHLKKKAKPLPETIEEMAPLYAAVVHGCLAGKNQEALIEVFWKRINRQGEFFSLYKLGAFGGAVAVLSAFFDPAWKRLAPGLSEIWQAWVLNEAGVALRALGRLPDAAGLLRLSLERRIAQEIWTGAAISASNLSSLLIAVGKLSEALTLTRNSVEFADKSGNDVLRRRNRTTLGEALHAMGFRKEAAAQYEEIARMEKPSLQGYVSWDLMLDQGQHAEVRERLQQVPDIANAQFGLISIAVNHLALGCAHLSAAQRGTAGDLAQATSHIQQAIDGFRRAGYEEHLPRGLLARAALHTHTQDFPAALHDLDTTLTLATRCGFRLHETDAHLGHARLALAEGHPVPARDHLAKARSIITSTGYHRRDEELAALEAALLG